MKLAEEVIVHDRLDAVVIALDRGELDRAQALLDDVRAHEGPNARLFALEGRLSFRRGRHEEARCLYERARALDPDSVGLQADMARLRLAMVLSS